MMGLHTNKMQRGVTEKLLCVILLLSHMAFADFPEDYDFFTDHPVTDCIHSFISTSKKDGYFTSPRYPNPYPAPFSCKYTFTGAEHEQVQIVFTDLDLNYPEGDKEKPYDCEKVDVLSVIVFEGNEEEFLGYYCGSKEPPQLMSKGPRMEVVFKSHTMSSAKGFKAQYHFISNYGITTGQQKDSGCNFDFHSEVASNGSFHSPNHPGLYPRNIQCQYAFYGKPNERVFITFPVYDVEGITPACLESTQSDYIELADGVVMGTPKRFCGTSDKHQIKEVSSTGNYFLIKFRSNNVYDARGFSAYYQFRGNNAAGTPGQICLSHCATPPSYRSKAPTCLSSRTLAFLFAIMTIRHTLLSL